LSDSSLPRWTGLLHSSCANSDPDKNRISCGYLPFEKSGQYVRNLIFGAFFQPNTLRLGPE
jgi:hypothetical protein